MYCHLSQGRPRHPAQPRPHAFLLPRTPQPQRTATPVRHERAFPQKLKLLHQGRRHSVTNAQVWGMVIDFANCTEECEQLWQPFITATCTSEGPASVCTSTASSSASAAASGCSHSRQRSVAAAARSRARPNTALASRGLCCARYACPAYKHRPVWNCAPCSCKDAHPRLRIRRLHAQQPIICTFEVMEKHASQATQVQQVPVAAATPWQRTHP